MNDSYSLQDEREVWDAIVERDAGPTVTKLRAYPGWSIRKYSNGTYDAASTSGALSPGLSSFREAIAWIRTQA